MSARIKILTATCLVVGLSMLMAMAPKPRVRAFAASFRIAPDSSVTATATVSVQGTLQPGDSIRYKFTKDGVVTLNKVGMPPSLTVSLTAPAYGQTSGYNACARVAYANGSQSAEKCGATPWFYSRPALPPPPATIDSIVITPASLSIAPLGKQQFAWVAF